MRTVWGSMACEEPDGFIRRFAGPWHRRRSAGADGATVVRFDDGGLVVLRAGDGCVDVQVEVPTEGNLDRFLVLVAEHLERSPAGVTGTVVWDR